MIKFSEELLQQIEDNCRTLYKEVSPPSTDYRKIASDASSPTRAREEVMRLVSDLSVESSGKRFLEIGSGYGMVPAIARTEFKMKAYGIEPGEQFSGSFLLSQEVVHELGCSKKIIIKANGENIPFEQETFDIVYSSNVFEHVENPANVLSEALRVLRPGGYLYIVIPNYGSWWEGHYGLLWLPHMPKFLARWYVRLLGRDPNFIDTLNFISHRSFKKIVDPYANELEVLGWGQQLWLSRFRSLSFNEWGNLDVLKKILIWLHRVKVTEVIIWFGKKLHWETPIVFIARKK